MAPKKQPNAPRTNDEALTPVATYSARGNQTIVRKSNDLIQNAMYSLTLSQQKLMLHIFAMIKPSDTELPRYEMSIYEFLKLCGAVIIAVYSHICIVRRMRRPDRRFD